ncbi:hypothetical protein SY2F82_46790 [Streptomyces sp. Y2F8-2]|nr:hypothetical protein SY2F82_46790 [Streptomyces sp. Y2F8-2]
MGEMIQSEALATAAEFVLSMLAQSEYGLLGAVLVSLVFMGVRAGRPHLALGAAVVFAVLMAQA